MKWVVRKVGTKKLGRFEFLNAGIDTEVEVERSVEGLRAGDWRRVMWGEVRSTS